MEEKMIKCRMPERRWNSPICWWREEGRHNKWKWLAVNILRPSPSSRTHSGERSAGVVVWNDARKQHHLWSYNTLNWFIQVNKWQFLHNSEIFTGSMPGNTHFPFFNNFPFGSPSLYDLKHLAPARTSYDWMELCWNCYFNWRRKEKQWGMYI